MSHAIKPCSSELQIETPALSGSSALHADGVSLAKQRQLSGSDQSFRCSSLSDREACAHSIGPQPPRVQGLKDFPDEVAATASLCWPGMFLAFYLTAEPSVAVLTHLWQT
jgi:hypothetical protein